MNKSKKRIIDGILLLNKPRGFSSNQALQKVKWIYQAKKAGHTGSLDPLATGMLPICFGEATKFSHFLLAADKLYETTGRLGTATSTGDAEGESVTTAAIPELSQAILEKTFKEFIGEINQVPPMYSALKYKGQPLYKLARQGVEVERKQRKVQIYAIKLLKFTTENFSIEVHCSKGTYIRTLIEDIANALGSVAHVSELHRKWVYPFEREPMYSLDQLTNLDALLLPVDAGLCDIPSMVLTSEEVKTLSHGQCVKVDEKDVGKLFRLYNKQEDRFFGIGEIKSEGLLAPKRLVLSNS